MTYVSPVMLASMATSLAREKKFDAAIPMMEQAVAAAPKQLSWRVNLAMFYRMINQLEPALAMFTELRKEFPDSPDIMHRAGHLLFEARQYDLARDIMHRGIQRYPDNPIFHLTLAEMLLMQEEWVPGWREYEWRTKTDSQKNALTLPDGAMWNGMKIKGTILVHADQGHGDIMQFMRFLPRVQDLCDGVIVAAPKNMHEVIYQVIPRALLVDGSTPIPEFKAFCRLGSLPFLLGINNPFEDTSPYFEVAPWPQKDWKNILPDRDNLRVGVCWRCNPDHPTFWRAMETSDILPLLEPNPMIDFVSLQLPKQEGLPEHVLDYSEGLTSFYETAALVSQLDIVATVDTSVAHVAGMQGKTCILMLPYYNEWRWGVDQQFSKWYPNTVIFRQGTPGDWKPVVQTARTAIMNVPVRIV